MTNRKWYALPIILLLVSMAITTSEITYAQQEGDGQNDGTGNQGNNNKGHDNKGDNNNGNNNTGDDNNGNGNTGDDNNGNDNTGDNNNGDNNTGDNNTGDNNHGNDNVGNDNHGDDNNGDNNTGDGHTGDNHNGEDGPCVGGGVCQGLPVPPEDDDDDKKGGGKDPLVFGTWSYLENSSDKCKSDHPFDYDNDFFKEDFCYNIVGSIFVVDFGSGINQGYNLLNFDGTAFSGMSPIAFLEQYPNTCENNDCYLWTDTNADWDATSDELEEFSFEVDYVRHFPDGKKLIENGRYAYCSGQSTDGEQFYCLQPTYWMKGR